MTDLSHLTALRTRLSNERNYLALATSAKEIAIRTVWVAQCEKEIAGELAFLGLEADPIDAINDMSIDELFAELAA